MSLISFWKSDPAQVRSKSVQQILGFAGDGILKDGNPTSLEFREFLSHVPSELLADFANYCLESPFKDSGLALQDIVNQVGVRLGFKVEAGKYRGTANPDGIGFDGLWRSPDGDAIVVEVKTTDAYRVSLDVVANYRKKLVAKGEIDEVKSSILYVVGRNDTGDLEAQVRGSRHAWDVRLISIDWLLRLMHLKESIEDPAIMEKVRDVLTPREYTRVDGIIELVFSTASEVKKEEVQVTADEDAEEEAPSAQKKFTPVAFRSACIDRISKSLGDSLVKRSAAIYSTPDEKRGVVCLISKHHRDSGASTNYWFAFHPSQKAAIEGFDAGFVCFGCGSADDLLVVPRENFLAMLDSFNKTIEEDREYWHVHIFRSGSDWTFHAKGGGSKIPASEFYLQQASSLAWP